MQQLTMELYIKPTALHTVTRRELVQLIIRLFKDETLLCASSVTIALCCQCKSDRGEIEGAVLNENSFRYTVIITCLLNNSIEIALQFLGIEKAKNSLIIILIFPYLKLLKIIFGRTKYEDFLIILQFIYNYLLKKKNARFSG